MKHPKDNPRLIAYEDIRWAEIHLRTVAGLAALAEAYAESCSTEWMAMHYSLESLRELMEQLVKDLKERMSSE